MKDRYSYEYAFRNPESVKVAMRNSALYRTNRAKNSLQMNKILLENDRIFLCRKWTQCEIYKINEDFILLEEWRHIGEEVIAVEIYISGTKISYNDSENSEDKLKDIIIEKMIENKKKKIKQKKIKLLIWDLIIVDIHCLEKYLFLRLILML